MGKVCVIGLDGATLELVRRWGSEGRLPHLQKLINGGVWGHLKTVPNQNSAPAWTSFATGKNPGKHGIFYFFEKVEGDYAIRYINGGACRAYTLWQILSNAGRKVGVINVPMTYPAQEVNGFLIAGMDAPGIKSRGFTHPKDLREELLREVPNYVIEPGMSGFIADNKHDKALEKARESIEARNNATLHFLKNHEWDFFMVVYREIDIAQHFFWKYMDKKHPDYISDEAERYRNAILNIYMKLDESIGILLKALPSDCIKVIMSDHGGALAEGGNLFLNHALEFNGLLEFKPQNKGQLKRWILDKILAVVEGKTKRNTKELLVRLFPTVRDKVDTTKYFGSINWQGTKVFNAGSRIELRLNMKDREPMGIVKKEEYDALCDEIKKTLLRWCDPLTKKRVVKNVLQKEKIYHGDHVDKAPDILVLFEDDVFVTGVGMRDDITGELKIAPAAKINRTLLNGVHRDNGIFIMNGPGIRRGIELKGTTIMDLAPTILYLMDIEIPSDMDGKTIWDALDESMRGRTSIQSGSSQIEMAGARTDFYTEEEKSVIEERLKGLGYIE